MSALKQIRLKCLDCCCGSSNEVKMCEIVTCPLHDYRFGKSQNRAARNLTDEQRAEIGARFKKAREDRIAAENS